MFDYKLGLVKEEVKKRSLLIVVAPLVALMVDHAKSLQDSGVHAVIVSSGGRENWIPESLLATEATLMWHSAVLSLLFKTSGEIFWRSQVCLTEYVLLW